MKGIEAPIDQGYSVTAMIDIGRQMKTPRPKSRRIRRGVSKILGLRNFDSCPPFSNHQHRDQRVTFKDEKTDRGAMREALAGNARCPVSVLSKSVGTDTSTYRHAYKRICLAES